MNDRTMGGPNGPEFHHGSETTTQTPPVSSGKPRSWQLAWMSTGRAIITVLEV